MKTALGIFIGRFQPFHNGHLETVKAILNQCEKLLIIIEEANSERTFRSPFTYAERKEMILRSLDMAIEVPYVRIMPLEIPDYPEQAINRIAEMVDRHRDAYDEPNIYGNSDLVEILSETFARHSKSPITGVSAEHIRGWLFEHPCNVINDVLINPPDVETELTAMLPPYSRTLVERLIHTADYYGLCAEYQAAKAAEETPQIIEEQSVPSYVADN